MVVDRASYAAAAAHDPLRRRAIFVSRRIALAIDVTLAAILVGCLAARYSTGDGLGFLAIGIGIGIATCIPIGIANVIVIDSACRHGARRALGASIGGAIADGLYAGLGIFGIGPLIQSYPSLPPVLHAISGCVLLGYGIVLLRSRPAFAELPHEHVASQERGQLRRGLLVGIGATLLNPSAIVTWVVVVGAHAAGVTRLQAGAWVTGIVVGTFAWFLVVMSLALRGRRVLRERAMWMTRIVAVLVIGSGLFSLARIAGLVG